MATLTRPETVSAFEGLSAYSLALVVAHRHWFADVVRSARQHTVDVGTDGEAAPWIVARRTWRPPIMAMYAARVAATFVADDAGEWRRQAVAPDLAPLEQEAPKAQLRWDDVPALPREDAGGLYLEWMKGPSEGPIVRDPREISDMVERHQPALLTSEERAVAETLTTHVDDDVNWIIPAGWQPAFAAAGILRDRKPADTVRWRGPAPHNLARAFAAHGLAVDRVAGQRAIARWLVRLERELAAPWADGVPSAGAEQVMLRAIARSVPWVRDHVIGGVVPGLRQ